MVQQLFRIDAMHVVGEEPADGDHVDVREPQDRPALGRKPVVERIDRDHRTLHRSGNRQLFQYVHHKRRRLQQGQLRAWRGQQEFLAKQIDSGSVAAAALGRGLEPRQTVQQKIAPARHSIRLHVHPNHSHF